ncbi:hypothetical protein F4805DRAFT_458163 [Annulohypoxylon moriforme]|nr:hypothetical protein F4805DRAFT_458163 [Annulohypoxylon moriforme]
MDPSNISPRRIRVYNLINRICSMEGLQPLEITDSTIGGRGPDPLTHSQLWYLEMVVEDRDAVEIAAVNSNEADSTSDDDGNSQNSSDSSEAAEYEVAPPRSPEESKEPLICDTCNKTFKSKATYFQHGREIHIGTSCHFPSCTFVASTETELCHHLYTHQGGENVKCQWPSCGKSYKTKESLLRHLRRHTISARAEMAAHVEIIRRG